MEIRDLLIQKYGGAKSRQLASSDEIGLPNCPFCGKDKHHFNVNVRTKTAGCLKCGRGFRGRKAYIKLIAKLEDVSFEKAERILLYGDKDKASAVVDILTANKNKDEGEKPKNHVNTKLPDEFELIIDPLRSKKKIIPTAFAKREYLDETLERFEIGFCRSGDYASRIIFPIKCRDKYSFVARGIHEWQNKKYKNPPGSKHSQLLFGYNLVQKGKTIVLVEGATDVLRMDAYHIYAVGTFGKKLSMEQIDLLVDLKPKEVIALFDSDALKQNQKAFERLSLRLNASYAILPEPYDPDNIPMILLNNALRNRTGISKLENALRLLKSFEKEEAYG